MNGQPIYRPTAHVIVGVILFHFVLSPGLRRDSEASCHGRGGTIPGNRIST